MTVAEFKSRFPAFALETDLRVGGYLTRAAPFFDVSRWGGFYSEGVGNWVAHNIVLDNQAALESPSTPNNGALTSKAVGPVSASYDSNLINKQADNPYLLTRYGKAYWRLARLVGAGGTAV